NDALIEEVCDIVGHHHHPREEETVNFKCLYDADLITNLEEGQKTSPLDTEKLKTIVEKSLLSEAGRKLAEETLLK
ncbi:MAG: phosphohydrolase, partial [Deltaproteobacteria bacterium]|nr:phosphohydrolase [Deltaproteobacteria bacterium]